MRGTPFGGGGSQLGDYFYAFLMGIKIGSITSED